MKLITKLRKADPGKKSQIWEKAFMDMSREQAAAFTHGLDCVEIKQP